MLHDEPRPFYNTPVNNFFSSNLKHRSKTSRGFFRAYDFPYFFTFQGPCILSCTSPVLVGIIYITYFLLPDKKNVISKNAKFLKTANFKPNGILINHVGLVTRVEEPMR